jgi:hypothetical protein
VTEYRVQIQSYQNGIAVGSDGAIWFAQWYPNGVARVTTSGVVSTVTLSASNAGGSAITLGADNKLWVAEGTSGALGRISAIGGIGAKITPTLGTAFNGSVASFKDGTPTATKTEFTASVSWGDGSKSVGTVTGPTSGLFAVSGTHTYATAGTFKLVVTLTDDVDKSTYTASPGQAKGSTP